MKKILFLKKAFTLAEVLITLAVIGVIAAAVIPTLISHYQKTQQVAGLKKAYSQMSQMFKQYMVDEGVSSLDQTTLFAQSLNWAELDKVITKYFKTVKVCKPGDNSCRITVSYLGNTNSSTAFSTDYNFFTADGMCFGIHFVSPQDCAPKNTPDLDKMKGECFWVDVDVNGIKPPNKIGRDYLISLIVGPDGNLYPTGGFAYSRYYGDESEYWRSGSYWCGTAGSTDIKNVTGLGCIARIMEEGWEMNY